MARREPQVKTGNLGALNATFDVNVADLDILFIGILGTFVGTISWSASDNGTNFVPINGTPIDSVTPAASVTAGGKGHNFNVHPLKTFRATMTAYTSGTANLRAAGYTR